MEFKHQEIRVKKKKQVELMKYEEELKEELEKGIPKPEYIKIMMRQLTFVRLMRRRPIYEPSYYKIKNG